MRNDEDAARTTERPEFLDVDERKARVKLLQRKAVEVAGDLYQVRQTCCAVGNLIKPPCCVLL